MGEQVSTDRPGRWSISRPQNERNRSAVRRNREFGSLAAPFTILLCCVALASCATATDDISARRDLEIKKLNESQTWKTDTAETEPEVMAAARTDRPDDSAVAEEADPDATTPAEVTGATLKEHAERERAAFAAEASDLPSSGAASGAASTTVSKEPGLPDLADEDLVRELLMRKLKQWEKQAGGYTQAADLTPDDDGKRLAREIVTLGFLADAGALDKTGLEAAAAALGTTGDREDLIRAALMMQQLGRRSESERLLRQLTEETPQPSVETTVKTALVSEPSEPAEPELPDATTRPEAPTFELVSVTFASRIDGPGDFVAMPSESIQRGKDVLVYGEFSGFRTLEQPAEEGGQPTHSRAFSASLRLENAEKNVLEELPFLPPSRGRQVVSEPGEAVNFWARYEIPEDLEPGSYEIVITAEDHFGGQSARANLGFEIK